MEFIVIDHKFFIILMTYRNLLIQYHFCRHHYAGGRNFCQNFLIPACQENDRKIN